ncbi:hypothetical protein HRbin36_02844 [bacterium HR36]|nr:hypothetical protein HRbin36_02844 [bacterium HR36]
MPTVWHPGKCADEIAEVELLIASASLNSTRYPGKCADEIAEVELSGKGGEGRFQFFQTFTEVGQFLASQRFDILLGSALELASLLAETLDISAKLTVQLFQVIAQRLGLGLIQVFFDLPKLLAQFLYFLAIVGEFLVELSHLADAVLQFFLASRKGFDFGAELSQDFIWRKGWRECRPAIVGPAGGKAKLLNIGFEAALDLEEPLLFQADAAESGQATLEMVFQVVQAFLQSFQMLFAALSMRLLAAFLVGHISCAFSANKGGAELCLDAGLVLDALTALLRFPVVQQLVQDSFTLLAVLERNFSQLTDGGSQCGLLTKEDRDHLIVLHLGEFGLA